MRIIFIVFLICYIHTSWAMDQLPEHYFNVSQGLRALLTSQNAHTALTWMRSTPDVIHLYVTKNNFLKLCCLTNSRRNAK